MWVGAGTHSSMGCGTRNGSKFSHEGTFSNCHISGIQRLLSQLIDSAACMVCTSDSVVRIFFRSLWRCVYVWGYHYECPGCYCHLRGCKCAVCGHHTPRARFATVDLHVVVNWASLLCVQGNLALNPVLNWKYVREMSARQNQDLRPKRWFRFLFYQFWLECLTNADPLPYL